MEDPKLIIDLLNSPGNFLSRISTLEQQTEEAVVDEKPDIEELTQGRMAVLDLALFPAQGILVTDPTSTSYTGGFVAGDGIDFSGSIYVSGNVVNGVIKTGFTDVGTLYAQDAVISGTIIIGTGSTAGGWFINSTSIFNSQISLDSSIPAILIGAATAIMTGAGVFIGNDSGTYKMRIGNPAGNYLLWDGTTLATQGQWIKSAGMNPALQEWETNIVFSSVSDVQINWTAGTIILSDGTTYSIVAGNTGTMAALTYIYLDIAVSLTVLQKTATYSTATGDGKILVAAAQNATAGASVIPFAGQQPIINGGAQITALSILAGNIAAGAITATKISVSSLSAITATMGSLTIDSLLTMSGAGGAITIGTTPPSSATVGTGLWIDRTGVYSLATNVQQATLTSLGLSAGAGAVKLNSAGIVIIADEYPPTALVTFVSDDTAALIASVTPYYLFSTLQSGYISNGYGKTASYEGINYAFAWSSDLSTFASLQIGSQGDARFDLKFGSNTAVGTKALYIDSEYSATNVLSTMLYLDLRSSGTVAAGYGPAITFRTENAAGTLEPAGFVAIPWVTATDTAEDSKVRLGFYRKGAEYAVYVGGHIFDHQANAANVTTGKTDLYSDTTIAGLLIQAGDKITFEYAGTTAAHATATRRITVEFGGTIIYDSGALATTTAADWYITGTIICESGTVVRCSAMMRSSASYAALPAQYTRVTGLTLSNTNILKITGQAGAAGAATNDIVARMGYVAFAPSIV